MRTRQFFRMTASAPGDWDLGWKKNANGNMVRSLFGISTTVFPDRNIPDKWRWARGRTMGSPFDSQERAMRDAYYFALAATKNRE